MRTTVDVGPYPGTLASRPHWAPGFDSRIRENAKITTLMNLPDPAGLAEVRTWGRGPRDRIFEIPCTQVLARIDDGGSNWRAGTLVVLPQEDISLGAPTGTVEEAESKEANQLAELASREIVSGQCIASREEGLRGLVEPVRKWMFDNVTVQSNRDALPLMILGSSSRRPTVRRLTFPLLVLETSTSSLLGTVR